jgi:mycothiol system anti-sigma-R factor
MDCVETQTMMHGYLDSELDLVRVVELERHLEECPHCQQAYSNQQALRAMIRAASLYHNAPDQLANRIHVAQRQAEDQNSRVSSAVPAKRRTHRFWARAWVFELAGASACLAILIFTVLRVVPWRGLASSDDVIAQQVLASHIRSLMPNHLTDVLSTDQHTVKPWFDGKLDYSPPVQDFADHDFALIGGRLDYLEDQSVAALVYQRRKHFINLFIWPSPDVARPANAARKGYNMVHWTEGGMNYWAVSELNVTELDEIVQRIRGAR